jgi:CRISPR-associated protein Cas1
MVDTEDGEREPIPISLVAHHAFCPRRAWLEAMGEQTDTHQMAVGVQAHAASDDPAASRPSRVRAVEVASRDLGVAGRCDTVEWDETGAATVVEQKSTPVRRRPVVTEPMVVQLALQVAALRETGVTVDGAAVYFTEHRQRVPVPIGPTELALARTHATRTAELLASGTAPQPLEDDRRCTRCSHAGVCLPDERALVEVRRRVLVADPDTQVLHLATPGARASVRAGRIRVHKGDEELVSVPLERVLAVVIHGNVDVSGGLTRELLWRMLPVVWCSSSGRVIGWAMSARSPNGPGRVRQHVIADRGHLGLAREFVATKIGNQATLLRRHGTAPDAVAALRDLRRRALSATSLSDLFGIEGDAAARYFGNFATMLAGRVRDEQGLRFFTRTRRPARDPINAALNFSYGLLLGDIIRAVASCGLDPHAGFLHSSGRNKPALALDLCEEFRAPVADSVVLGAFNNGELHTTDFSTVTGSTQLRPSGRSALIAAYERRVGTTFRHPTFGYEVTWRRAMEIQARLVLGVLDGTQPSYKGVTIR